MCQGIAAELEGIDLGDKRLNKRSEHIIEALAADPQASGHDSVDNRPDSRNAGIRKLVHGKVDPID